MSIDVPHYGVHWTQGDIAFLQQARGGTNAVGAPIGSPYSVRTKKRWQVNHLFGLNATNPARSHLDALQLILERNSLARFLLPIPKQDGDSGVGLFYAANFDECLLRLACLLKMSSPIRLPVMWANLANPKTVTDELDMTNVQPYVLIGVGVDHMSWVKDVMRYAATAPRKLLVVASPDVPFKGHTPLEATELTSRHLSDLMALPWETFGSIILRAYMRHEWDGLWFTREPIPGNEAKVKPT